MLAISDHFSAKQDVKSRLATPGSSIVTFRFATTPVTNCLQKKIFREMGFPRCVRILRDQGCMIVTTFTCNFPTAIFVSLPMLRGNIGFWPRKGRKTDSCIAFWRSASLFSFFTEIRSKKYHEKNHRAIRFFSEIIYKHFFRKIIQRRKHMSMKYQLVIILYTYQLRQKKNIIFFLFTITNEIILDFFPLT